MHFSRGRGVPVSTARTTHREGVIIILLGLMLIEVKKANRRLAGLAVTCREGPGALALGRAERCLKTILRRTSYLREARNSLAVLEIYARKLHPEVDLDGHVVDGLGELKRLRDHDTPLNENDEQLYRMLQPHVDYWRSGASRDEWDEACDDPVTPLFRSELRRPTDEETG